MSSTLHQQNMSYRVSRRITLHNLMTSSSTMSTPREPTRIVGQSLKSFASLRLSEVSFNSMHNSCVIFNCARFKVVYKIPCRRAWRIGCCYGRVRARAKVSCIQYIRGSAMDIFLNSTFWFLIKGSNIYQLLFILC